MGSLYEQFASVLPRDPAVRDFVQEVEGLPGLAGWRMEEPTASRWPTVVGWGHVLTMTRNIPGGDRIRTALAKEILNSGAPAPETFAELSAAGLCIALGAVAAGRIPEGSKRTADWRMVWPTDAEMDVEVTVGNKKKAHVQRRAAAHVLASGLLDSSRPFDLIIDVVDPTRQATVDEIRLAVEGISEGDRLASSGCWEVRAEPITREPTVLFIAGQDQAPDWWPAAHARSCAWCAQVAVQDAAKAPPQVRVWTGLPFDSYVNPAKRKAEAPQGTKGLPFLVAVDIQGLPGAFGEIPCVVEGLLPFWTAVSGILLFQDLAGFDGVGWMWRLVQNPHAHVQLPESFSSGRAEQGRTMETVARFGRGN